MPVISRPYTEEELTTRAQIMTALINQGHSGSELQDYFNQAWECLIHGKLQEVVPELNQDRKVILHPEPVSHGTGLITAINERVPVRNQEALIFSMLMKTKGVVTTKAMAEALLRDSAGRISSLEIALMQARTMISRLRSKLPEGHQIIKTVKHRDQETSGYTLNWNQYQFIEE